jgi:hypothetical protein
LELDQARDRAEPGLDWREAAQALEALDPEHWGPVDDLLAGFGQE